ncbi:hypothetical protein SLS62_010333 [Diatrype stigma]|uniref:Uncharacterized protein n=1 Tax=Diatrype stigma TaxID=117547 RepID=A0AAN9YGM1_9PEZI
MAPKKSKAKIKQAKPAGSRGSAHHGRVDHRTMNMALPLTPAVRARFPKDFDAEFYARPFQQAIGKIIFVLFGPYLQSNAAQPLSQIQAHHLVQQNHAEAMSQVHSGTSAQTDTFWVERDNAVIMFKSRAFQTVRAMPMITISFHLWTLWALDAFSTKAARWTFTGHSLDDEMRNATPSTRQSIQHRVVYDAYRPFIDLNPGGIQSRKDISQLVEKSFSTALQSIHALIPTLDENQSTYAKQVTNYTKQSITDRLHRLWELNVFISEESRSRHLAPPLTHGCDIKDLSAPLQGIAGSKQHNENNRGDFTEAKTKDVPITEPPSGSKTCEEQPKILPVDTALEKTERQRRNREEKRRNIYLAIRPFIEPHVNEVLPASKIKELVHECLKSRTFLDSIPIEEAINSITRLWNGRVFHDSHIRSQILGMEEVSEDRQRIVIKREPMSSPVSLAKIPVQGDQSPLKGSNSHPCLRGGINDAASDPTCQQRSDKEPQNVHCQAYLAAAPAVKCHTNKKLSREEIAAIVREIQKLPGFLTSMSEKRAIDLVWDLWSRGAFHDRLQGRNLLDPDIGIPSIQYQDIYDGVSSALRPVVNLPKIHTTAANTAASLGSCSNMSGNLGQPLSTLPVNGSQTGFTRVSNAGNPYTSSKSEASLARVGSMYGSNDTHSIKAQKLSAKLTHSLTTANASSETWSKLAPTAGVKRSLDDLYRDHLEKGLGPTTETMLNLMATTIQHVAEEAVFEWLKRWCPMNSFPTVIRQISENNFDGWITVPEEAAHSKQSIPGLLQKCKKTNRESDGHNNEDIVDTVNNAMELCLALKDNKRRASLEMVEDKVRAVRSSLYVHCMEIKRRTSEQLASLHNSDLPRPSKRRMGVGHQQSQSLIMDEAYKDFEKHYDASSIELLTAFQRLLDSSATNEPPALPIWKV